jgi:hypothetical protein
MTGNLAYYVGADHTNNAMHNVSNGGASLTRTKCRRLLRCSHLDKNLLDWCALRQADLELRHTLAA